MEEFSISTVFFLLLTIISGCGDETPSDDSAQLENNAWKLLRYGLVVEDLEDFPIDKQSTLYFNAETQLVKGVVLCNSFESAYTKTETSVSIVSVAPTEIFCGDDNQGLASFIVTSLSSINKYEVDGNKLKIYTVESRVLEYEQESAQ